MWSTPPARVKKRSNRPVMSVSICSGGMPLKNVATTYEDQINSRVESMTALIEPIMIICMGGMVGFIVISVLMPLMDMSNINNH